MPAYVYYSYEEWGRGYIGSRARIPIGDETYFGSFKDKTFKPTSKIVLAEFDSAGEALAAEIELHNFFQVDFNLHFANRAKQTSTGWIYRKGGPKWDEERKKRARGRKRSEQTKQKMRESWTDSLRQEHGKKISNTLKGRPKSDRHKQNLSNSVRGRKFITNDFVTKVHDPSLSLPDGYRWGRAKGITKRKGKKQ